MLNTKKIFAGVVAVLALSVSLAQPVCAQYYTGLLPYPWYRWRGWPLNMLWGQGNYYNGYGYGNAAYWVNSAVNNVANPYGNGYYGYRPANYYGTRYPTQMQQYQDVEPYYAPRQRVKQKRQLPMVVDNTQHAQWQNAPAYSQSANQQLAMHQPPALPPEVKPMTGPSAASRFVDQVNQRHYGNVSSALFDPQTRSLAREAGVINTDDLFEADFGNDRLEQMRGILQDQSLSPEVRAQTISVLIKHRGVSPAQTTMVAGSKTTNWH